MVTRAQIDRLKTRIEALAPPPMPPCAGARERFLERIEGIGSRLRTAAAVSGESWPPPISADERRGLTEYLASVSGYNTNERTARPQN